MKNLSVKRQQSMVSAPTQIAEYPKTPLREKWYMFTQWVATYSLQIFWLTLYSLVLMGIFIERAVCKYEP
jgi:membrane-anchored protein YejM (alkaline phosphatase superfamily)